MHDPAGNPCVANAAGVFRKQLRAFNRLPDRSTARTQYKRCLTPGSALDDDEVWSLTTGPPRRAAVWQSGTKGEPLQGPMGGLANQDAQLTLFPHPGEPGTF